MKHLANIITSLRFVFAAFILFAAPFSCFFWGMYLCGGMSDLLDGMVARGMKQQNNVGAKLDSIADVAFLLAILTVGVKNVNFPTWVWACAAGIMLIRLIAYGIGYHKYRTFSSLHTNMNKITGVLLFAFPVFYVIFGRNGAGAILCFISFTSSVEELLITVKSKMLNRDCKSIFKC